jgi:hypothetical protein
MFCVHCGKPSNAQVRFCPHCGKQASGAAAAAPAAPAVPQNLYSTAIPQTPQPVQKPTKEKDPNSGKKLAIALSSLGGAVVLGLGIWGGIALLGSGGEKSALAEGLTNNCDTVFSEADVFDAEVQDKRGLKTFSVFVDGRSMDWVLVQESSAEYSFEIDSIFSASAIRAQFLGCELAFTVRK